MISRPPAASITGLASLAYSAVAGPSAPDTWQTIQYPFFAIGFSHPLAISASIFPPANNLRATAIARNP
jgi:hypothetical protein